MRDKTTFKLRMGVDESLDNLVVVAKGKHFLDQK
jgi:hypothetical protein